ncbi:MAG: hypothetical protein ACLFM8_06445 [Halobacteriales archaeon]
MRRRTLIAGVAIALAGCLGDDERLDARGDIAVTVDGEPVDLTADRFQAEHVEDAPLDFHLHEGDDDWYMEGERRVTVAEAIDLLPAFGYERTDDGVELTIDGTTYDLASSAVEVTYLVDGVRVDPEDHRLADGETVHIEVET